MSAKFRTLLSWLRPAAPKSRRADLRARPQLVPLETRDTPANFVVMNAGDAGPGSLRQAILDAQANTEDDRIDFDFGVAGPINLASTISIADNKLIDISPSFPLTVAGTNAFRLFDIAAGSGVKMQSFILTGGKDDDGGAIRNAGKLELSGVRFVGNTATNNGGAVANTGTVTVAGSTFSTNSATGNGGAIANTGTGLFVVKESTVGESVDPATQAVRPGNDAALGGGLFNGGAGKMFVINSTVHKNDATTGGGIANVSTEALKITNSTIAFNTTSGIFNDTNAVTTANNTIVIGNKNGATPADVAGDPLTGSQFNLIGDAATAGGLTDGTAGNIVGVADPATVLAPLFTQFQTAFYPLKDGSPAIDKGSNALAVDETGAALLSDQGILAARVAPAGGTVDIGSREFVQVPPFEFNGGTITGPEDTKLPLAQILTISTTFQTDSKVVLTANDGTLKFNGTATGVSNVTGDGTAKLSFDASPGALLGGFANVLDFTPSKDAYYAAAAGKKLVIDLANGTTTKQFEVPLVIDPVADAPVGAVVVTRADTAVPVTVSRAPVDGPEIQSFKIANIVGGTLFVDEARKIPVPDGSITQLPVTGTTPDDSLRLFFLPNAGFTGAAKFDVQAALTKDGSGDLSPAFTQGITVTDAKIPFVPAADPGYATYVTFRQNGATSYDFTVNFADDTGISVSKLGDGDVKVTGRTNGFSQAAKFLGVDMNTNGTPRTATYRITPPGGTWDAADKDTYVISVVANEVFDTDGNAVVAQDVTTFLADLTADKTGAPGAAVTVAAVGDADANKTSYTFTINFTAATAIDTATINKANDLVQVLGPNGYIVGADFVSLDSTANGTPRTATYKITPPGGSWDKTDNGTYRVILGNSALDDNKNAVTGGELGTFAVNVTTSPPPVDTTAPTATLASAPAVVQANAGQTTYDFTVTFADNVAINAATLDGSDVRVTGPNGFNALASFVKADATGNGTPRTATYRITPPGGAWDFADNGTYTVAVEAKQVADTAGNNVAAGNLGTFTATLAAPPAATGRPIAVGGAANGVVRFDPNGKGQFTAPPVAVANPFAGLGVTVRTATADVNGDGIPDTIMVTGPGTPGRFAVVSGVDNKTVLVAPTDPYGDAGGFVSGGFVVAADMDGDGRAEIVITPDIKGGPRVIVARLGADGKVSFPYSFIGIQDAAFRDGARAALGDFNKDGAIDIAVIAAFNGGPRTAIFDGKTIKAGTPGAPPKLIGDFFATKSAADEGRGGRYLSAGDVNGDGFADLIVTGDPTIGGGAQVTIFSGADLAVGKVVGTALLADFAVTGVNPAGGVRVAAVNVDGDARADLAVGSGTGQRSLIKVYNGTALVPGAEPTSFSLDPFSAALAEGVFVG